MLQKKTDGIVDGSFLSWESESGGYVETNNARIYYVPTRNGYIVINKYVKNTPGGKTYVYEQENTNKSLITNFRLSEEISMNLVVSDLPAKIRYEKGEAVDYSGAVIRASYDDGTLHTVTDYCTFTPANGSILTAPTTVTVSCDQPVKPYAFDLNNGYMENFSDPQIIWCPSEDTLSYIDAYEVVAGHKYLLALGASVGNCFRAMFTTTRITGTKASNVSGEKILWLDWPGINFSISYTPSSSGYILISKDSNGTQGIKTYLYDAGSSDKFVETTFQIVVDMRCQLIREKCTWTEAKEKCEAMGGHLATSTSAEKNSFLKSVAEGCTVWLGAKRVGESWNWITGETWSYTNWDSPDSDGRYQPDNYGGYQDALSMRSNGKWDDLSSSGESGGTEGDGYQYFLCEWD